MAPRNSMGEKLTDRRNDDPAYQNGVGSQTVRSPFRFGAWIRLHGLDIITMAALGAVALGVYFANPAPSRSFPIYNLDGSVIYPQFAYPLRKEIIPIWAAALIAFLVPFVFITLFQIRRRSADDWLTTNLGLLKSLITAATFQVFIKWLIGGLRPHFYAVCQPRVTPGPPTGNGFAQLMYDRTICTGDPKKINDALESMPSGHSTAAWAGLFYLALYFNAQLKVISAHNPAYWKMIMFFAPLLGAFLISGALTIDKYHHWYDLVVGGIIGTACALVAFRQTFASITDFRFNHILLPRATSLFHRTPFLPISGRGPYFDYHRQQFQTHDLPFTREGGWGLGGGEQGTGAPGDATVLSASGMGLGGLGGQHNGGTFGTGTGGVGGGMPHGGVGNGVGGNGVGGTGPAIGHNAPVGTAGVPPAGHQAV
ncbi:prenyl diphosphate phosphatase [Ephemerocybe angulata]|uniref:Prenyl diphosphate phosphatase n=1 Tax=Ephemerocybe angulata TaxID=980116 RepID=A0A8H6IGR4_9AGAR|nr:prenyl diphosphate phosphatase [Tulosesus angulatus]